MLLEEGNSDITAPRGRVTRTTEKHCADRHRQTENDAYNSSQHN